MAVNRDKPDRWKADIAQSVDFYNQWFLVFAPQAYRDTRIETTKKVEEALKKTGNLKDISPKMLQANPGVLPMLRMSTCPPIARDRLIGLSGITSPNLVKVMELNNTLPLRMGEPTRQKDLERICNTLERLADKDIFVWLERGDNGTKEEVHRAATIVADRLCGAEADPIIRNAQEKRQLNFIREWLEARGYDFIKSGAVESLDTMPSGTFAFRLNVPVYSETGTKINIPIDAVIMPKTATKGTYPLLIEAKSAGDYANVNKRRKEEAQKMSQLRKTYYGKNIQFNLFLCGYFDSPYLGYEAAEGIDWVWEHRIDDLAGFGL